MTLGVITVTGYLRYLLTPPMTKASPQVLYKAPFEHLGLQANLTDSGNEFLIVDLPTRNLLVIDQDHRHPVTELHRESGF